MIEEIAPHQEFKTRKQIRYEKYGIDEDEDAILNQKIHMPRRKQHEIFESVDDLSERHKVIPFRSKKAGRFEKLDTWLSESLVRHHTTPFLFF